jgi:ankyrin repeat protein
MSLQDENLEWAVMMGDIPGCKSAIADGARVNKASGAWGPLHEACDRANPEVCSVLIDAGAVVSSLGNRRTPLMLASRRGSVEICQMLLKAGAEPCQLGANNDNALYEACFQGHAEVVELLIRAGVPVDAKLLDSEITVLMTAARRGHAELCSLLISAGADVEARGGAGATPLFNAVLAKDLAVVQTLIEAGASTAAILDLDRTPPLTPFQLAVHAEAIEIVEYMLDELGEDPAQRTLGGKTMVQLAGKNKEVKQLINAAKTASRVVSAVGSGPVASANASASTLKAVAGAL